MGKDLEGQKQRWCYEQQRKDPIFMVKVIPFICYDYLVDAAHCLELLGQRKRFVCLTVVTVCSTSNCWRVLVIKLFVSKQKACYALIHRILNLVWSQRNNLLRGTE